MSSSGWLFQPARLVQWNIAIVPTASAGCFPSRTPFEWLRLLLCDHDAIAISPPQSALADKALSIAAVTAAQCAFYLAGSRVLGAVGTSPGRSVR